MSIEKTTSNPPQICKVQIAPVSSVASQLSIKSFATIIDLNEGETWQDIYGSFSSITFSEKEDVTSAGNIYQQQVQLFHPGLEHAALDAINNLIDRPIIVLVHYQNDSVKVIGSLAFPAFLRSSFESGSKTGYSIQINCSMQEKSRLLFPDLNSVP